MATCLKILSLTPKNGIDVMGKQTVLLDNNAWDFLRDRQVDLRAEAGTDLHFTISRLGEIEIPSKGHTSADARATNAYATEQMANLAATPVEWFVLGDLNDPDAGSGGFGDLQPNGEVIGGGYIGSLEGLAYAADDSKHKKLGGSSGTATRPTGLLQNQTDIDYGQWAMDIPVVTKNIKDFKHARLVIDLNKWVTGSFGDFIRTEIAAFT